MKRLSTLSMVLAAFVAITTNSVSAAGNNTTNYGQYGHYRGAPASQTLTVDKTVGLPSQTKGGQVQFVDNLTSNDVKFAPGQNIMFQIKVRNTSTMALSNITITDYVPTYIEPLEGPGQYDKNARKVTYVIANLNPGEERVHNVNMQVVAQDQLPTDKGLMCLTNKAEAVAGSARDNDSAQFCVEKQVIGAKTVPTAGPEYGIAFGAFNLLTLGAGLYLKKRS